MKKTGLPEMLSLKQGDSLKTLNITADKGMSIPVHHSTKEAVIVVLHGKATLSMPDGKHKLVAGTSIIIPEMVAHSLTIEEQFHAIVIMETTSEIEFIA